MRMHNRRFTRLTNAFSKKFENHAHMVAIYAVWYNWVRIHKTLKVTPAMEVGLSKTLLTWEDLIAVMDAEAPKTRDRAALTRSARPKFQTDAGNRTRRGKMCASWCSGDRRLWRSE